MAHPFTHAQELRYRRVGKNQLLPFVEYTHPSWVTSDHHEKLCAYLEALEALDECPYCNQPIDALVVNAPPRHSKTETVSRRYPAWCFGKHPEWQMICAQATGLLASDTGADVRDIVKSPEFRRVFKDVKLREDAQAAGRWLTSEGGVYYAAGVDGTIVGRGANILNIDDPHSGRAAADSQRMRDIAGNWYFGDALTRLMPPARQLLTLTRWHMDDLAGRLLSPVKEWKPTEDFQFFCAGDWHVLRFRAIEFEGTAQERALWPDRYPLEWLKKVRGKMQLGGRGREWESQYQQNPVAEEGAFLKREWFDQRYDELPRDLTLYIITDFAVSDTSTQKDPDKTELGVVGLANDDRLYVIDWEDYIATADVWIESLMRLIKKYKPHCIHGEKGVIKASLEPMLERAMDEHGINAYFEWTPTMGDKLARGRSFQGYAARKKIVFPKRSPWADRVINDIVSVGGGGRYWDAFDAFSNFFMSIDDNDGPSLPPDEKPVKKVDIWEEVELPSDLDVWRTR